MPNRRRLSRLPLMAGLAVSLGFTSACQAPDARALHKLACEQAAVSLDLQSVGQVDALRRALGVAPDVDPIGTCKALGVNMNPRQDPPPAGEVESN